MSVVGNIEEAIRALLGKAEADFNAEKAVIAADVRTSVANLKAFVVAETPVVEADVKAAVATALAALEAALAAHGL
jgi:Asp-tRNA(Asn)/Glu-tRNA(Gln) amidotransferase A subunit family amidase